MSADKRRRIDQLRALARSTTFPAERDSANQKADALEEKLRAQEPPQPANDHLKAHRAYEESLARAWDDRERQTRQPKQPWRGSPGEHDQLYAEALARALKEMAYRQGLSERVRDILARKQAMKEMMRRFEGE